jgi:L-threonylcarbamoyladenylate synthase
MIIRCKKSSKFVIEAAADTLKSGGVIVYPTETAYGLGCDARNAKAIQRIYGLKGRSSTKALPVIVADLKMAKKYLSIDKKAEALIKRFMPGPLTLVVKAREGKFPKLLMDKGTVAFRISSYPFASAIAKQCGFPVTSTSANPSGIWAIYNSEKMRAFFTGKVALIVDVGNLKKTKKTKPSTIVDISSSDIKLLREGPIPFSKIQKAADSLSKSKRQ